MKTIGVRELRQHASRYLARVEASVLIPASRPGILDAIDRDRLPGGDLSEVLDQIREER